MNTTLPDLQHARARDGTGIAYRLDGDARSERRIVLVHSLAMDHRFWSPVAALLADDFHVLTYDCRGHGASGKAPGPYSVELFARDLADLLDHVGWSQAVVAGASMGGSVALAFASLFASRVAALGLIDTTAWYGADAAGKWAERAAKAEAEGLGALVAFQKTRWFADAFREEHPGLVDACVQTFVANDVACFAATCAMLGSFDLRAALPSLRMPVAIVVGSEDYATPPAMAEVLHAGIPAASFTLLEGARHLTPLERTDAIVDVLRALVARETA